MRAAAVVSAWTMRDFNKQVRQFDFRAIPFDQGALSVLTTATAYHGVAQLSMNYMVEPPNPHTLAVGLQDEVGMAQCVSTGMANQKHWQSDGTVF